MAATMPSTCATAAARSLTCTVSVPVLTIMRSTDAASGKGIAAWPCAVAGGRAALPAGAMPWRSTAAGAAGSGADPLAGAPCAPAGSAREAARSLPALGRPVPRGRTLPGAQPASSATASTPTASSSTPRRSWRPGSPRIPRHRVRAGRSTIGGARRETSLLIVITSPARRREEAKSSRAAEPPPMQALASGAGCPAMNRHAGAGSAGRSSCRSYKP